MAVSPPVSFGEELLLGHELRLLALPFGVQSIVPTNPGHFHSNTGTMTTKAVTVNLIRTPKAIHMISAKTPTLMPNNRPPSPRMAQDRMEPMVSFRLWFEGPC